MYKSTCSLEAAIVIEAFGGVLMRKHIYGDIKDLVVVVVVFCGSILTHLVTKNKEVVLKKGTKKMQEMKLVMSKIEVEIQLKNKFRKVAYVLLINDLSQMPKHTGGRECMQREVWRGRREMHGDMKLVGRGELTIYKGGVNGKGSSD